MAPENTVLDINALHFGYSSESLLYCDFSLTLKRGELISIVGESGSGKSTLFELITGHLSPFKGSIKTLKIAQIYQDPYSSFHHSYTIKDQIADVACLEELPHLLPRLALEPELLDKKPYELSGGQLQRCSILRALLMKPDLLLCDEPTSALDNVIQLDVMKLLVSLLDLVGILLITHDPELSRWCSDRTIHIQPPLT